MPTAMIRTAAAMMLGVSSLMAQAGVSDSTGVTGPTPVVGVGCFADCDAAAPYLVAGKPVLSSVQVDAPMTLMLLGFGLLLLRFRLRRSGLAI